MDNSFNTYQNSNSSSLVNIAKVFLYVFIGLLITAGATALIGYLYSLWVSIQGGAAVPWVIGISIASGIIVLITSMVMNFKMLKEGRYSIPLTILYALLIGVGIAGFTIMLPWGVLASAFGISAGIFALLALVAFLGKRSNMNMLAVVGSFLFIGAGSMFFFAWIFMLLFPGFSYWVFLIYMLVTFAAIMLVTIYDIWRINQICEMGSMTKDLSIYCAITLYNDFIHIFFRVLYFLIRIFYSSR